MKYIFVPNDEPKGDWKDWYEATQSTPEDSRASFFCSELREWFYQWVFKPAACSGQDLVESKAPYSRFAGH